MDGQDDSDGTAGLKHEVLDGILWVSVWGSVGLQAVTAYATRHQKIWSEQDRVLWDLRRFDPSGITSKDVLNIQHAFAEIMDLRGGGRSAVLIGKELELVVRVTLVLQEGPDGPVQIRSFLDEAQALAWLNEI